MSYVIISNEMDLSVGSTLALTSVTGGIGGVIGTLVGAIFIATLLNGLVILNVTSF
ncbi:MAG: hypothetical protein U0703_25365 [Anaerolineae bacterium]